MTTLQITQVDAFSDRPFAGNPAGVCLDGEGLNDQLMQSIAAEMNLAETAFARQLAEGLWTLRWFTPTTEVDLCGHATLATAHVIWETAREPRGAGLTFQSRSGKLLATQDGDAIVLDFPSQPVEAQEATAELLAALGIEKPRFAGRNASDWLIELDNEGQVRTISPNMGLLAKVDARGVIVTAVARPGNADFVSRYFAPAFGIPEDPVTGSAHCALAPYWMERLRKLEMTGHQLSARGGIVGVTVDGERVRLRGQACTVLRGELTF